MNLPPFPATDLAKLVLGYLGEEQCMTAYDEFLRTSPYLDPHQNEYDNVVMTSLKNILAEYRAVKIHIRNCKPIALRRRLLQYHTLLDVFKFLCSHVDIHKAFGQKNLPIHTSTPQSTPDVSTQAPKECEMCHTIERIDGCVCKNQPAGVPNFFATPFKMDAQQAAAISNVPLDTLVETSNIADLPGNTPSEPKRSGRISPTRDTNSTQSSAGQVSRPSDDCIRLAPMGQVLLPENSGNQNSLPHNVLKVAPSHCSSYSVKSRESSEYSKSEFQSRFSQNDTQRRDEFIDISSPIEYTSNKTDTMPDSSTSDLGSSRMIRTSEGMSQLSMSSQNNTTIQNNYENEHSLSQITHNTDSNSQSSSAERREESKITILSNDEVKTVKEEGQIIVNKLTGERCHVKIPPNPSIQSVPPMKMQTIFINSAPSYKDTHDKLVFTSDEIMAMPTVILLPQQLSGLQKSSPNIPINSLEKKETEEAKKIKNKSPNMAPLTVDVRPNVQFTTSVEGRSILNTELPTASVSLEKLNTPQMCKPVRKSLSTPRRTSHVRVLDFTTPRRILESAPSEESIVSVKNDAEKSTLVKTVLRSPTNVNIVMQNHIARQRLLTIAPLNKVVKKRNWDDDLRAPLDPNEPPPPRPRPKPKPKKVKTVELKEQKDKKERMKNKGNQTDVETDKTSKKKSRTKSTEKNTQEHKKDKPKKKTPKAENPPDDKKNKKPRSKKKKLNAESRKELEEAVQQPIHSKIKPTIKIIPSTSKNYSKHEPQIPPSETITEQTPENDHHPLENPISAKLNLSDFLETPYKQALYDIQMDTPRFLGQDLPSLSLSDVKITTIPTPSFFPTPKGVLATPSSYSSRPTDYSSGGSYYKPDDGELPLVLDLDPIPQISPAKPEKTLIPTPQKKLKTRKKVDSEKVAVCKRPVRSCRLQVSSYYDGPGSKSTSQSLKSSSDDSDESSSSCSTCSGNSSNKSPAKVKRRLSTHRASAEHTSSSKSPEHFRDKSKEAIVLEMKKKRERTLALLKSKKSPVKRKSTSAINRLKPKVTPKSITKSRVKNNRKSNNKENSPKIEKPPVKPALTKSRRKSSTPRKLQCSNEYLSQKELAEPQGKKVTVEKSNSKLSPQADSEAECLNLHWSDDANSQELESNKNSEHTSEDIAQIKDYVEKTNYIHKTDDSDSLHVDLLNQNPECTREHSESDILNESGLKNNNSSVMEETETQVVSDSSNYDMKSNKEVGKIKSVQKSANTSKSDEDGTLLIEKYDDIELSVCECNEESKNYFVSQHDESFKPSDSNMGLVENFSMEVCIEESESIRVSVTNFAMIIDENCSSNEIESNINKGSKEIEESAIAEATCLNLQLPKHLDESQAAETAAAVETLACMHIPLYTPVKDPHTTSQRVCLELFDSTLNSLDTPIKTPYKHFEETSNIVVEIETNDPTPAKRKRSTSNVSDDNDKCKKQKPEPQLLSQLPNFDIESVLTKLHGP